MQKDDISQAVFELRAGNLVAIPTETVYGLGADARNPVAVRKIFLAKQRPSDHPVIVHLHDLSQLPEWTRDVSDEALLLANTFWPGPLTLILKKAPTVHEIITGGQDTIGIRIPNHPVALAVLKAFGSGIAAPSANRFGRISPTTATAVREELGEALHLILEGGQCAVGLESTIVDMSGSTPVILRPGMITAGQIEAVLKAPLAHHKNNAPRVSGSFHSHYAPVTKTLLCSTEQIDVLLTKPKENIAILARTFSTDHPSVIRMPADPLHYAHDVYQVLRELDKKNLQEIIIEQVPDTIEWAAIRDRLTRAAHSIIR
ncbi:MAG TPA: L-threonylcarbamoyladenylate synthase [Gammaproteobacteria bacterium]|nr:L-threonylcarbamoyladenylate synthase [Gammaproteobacteria bacterium]